MKFLINWLKNKKDKKNKSCINYKPKTTKQMQFLGIRFKAQTPLINRILWIRHNCRNQSISSRCWLKIKQKKLLFWINKKMRKKIICQWMIKNKSLWIIRLNYLGGKNKKMEKNNKKQIKYKKKCSILLKEFLGCSIKIDRLYHEL